MATNTNKQAIFTNVARRSAVRLTAANTTRDLSSTTNALALVVAPTEGARISSISFIHSAASQTQASVAAVGRVWLTDVGGTNPKLFKEIALPLVTPSATAIGGVQTITLTSDEGWIPSGKELWVGMSAAQTSGQYDVVANGGDFTL